jgi:hypothetical protein
MQMLQAGGLPVLTDGQRAADEHNPRGYFEHEGVKHSRADVSWLNQAEGRVVKVIHLLLLHLPPERNYQVVFMLRNIEEVIASQRTMLRQQGRPGATLTDATLAQIFEAQLKQVRQWLAERPHFRVLYLDHRRVIREPLAVAGEVNEFLGGQLLVPAMVEVVNPSLHRQRKNGL